MAIALTTNRKDQNVFDMAFNDNSYYTNSDLYNVLNSTASKTITIIRINEFNPIERRKHIFLKPQQYSKYKSVWCFKVSIKFKRADNSANNTVMSHE